MVAAAVAIRALSLPSISSSSNNKQKLPHNNTYDERKNSVIMIIVNKEFITMTRVNNSTMINRYCHKAIDRRF